MCATAGSALVSPGGPAADADPLRPALDPQLHRTPRDLEPGSPQVRDELLDRVRGHVDTEMVQPLQVLLLRGGQPGLVLPHSTAPYASAQKSVNTRGGSGESIMRWVSRMPITPSAGSV